MRGGWRSTCFEADWGFDKKGPYNGEEEFKDPPPLGNQSDGCSREPFPWKEQSQSPTPWEDIGSRGSPRPVGSFLPWRVVWLETGEG